MAPLGSSSSVSQDGLKGLSQPKPVCESVIALHMCKHHHPGSALPKVRLARGQPRARERTATAAKVTVSTGTTCTEGLWWTALPHTPLFQTGMWMMAWNKRLTDISSSNSRGEAQGFQADPSSPFCYLGKMHKAGDNYLRVKKPHLFLAQLWGVYFKHSRRTTELILSTLTRSLHRRLTSQVPWADGSRFSRNPCHMLICY